MRKGTHPGSRIKYGAGSSIRPGPSLRGGELFYPLPGGVPRQWRGGFAPVRRPPMSGERCFLRICLTCLGRGVPECNLSKVLSPVWRRTSASAAADVEHREPLSRSGSLPRRRRVPRRTFHGRPGHGAREGWGRDYRAVCGRRDVPAACNSRGKRDRFCWVITLG